MCGFGKGASRCRDASVGYTEPKKECGRKVFPLWHFWNVDQLMHGQARVICGTFFYGLACSGLGLWNTFAAGFE